MLSKIEPVSFLVSSLSVVLEIKQYHERIDRVILKRFTRIDNHKGIKLYLCYVIGGKHSLLDVEHMS